MFGAELAVRGHRVGRHGLLRCESPAVPNAIAALLLHVRDRTGSMPDAYFGWTEGNPIEPWKSCGNSSRATPSRTAS